MEITGFTLCDRVRSSTIKESLKVEQLLLQIKRNQLKWFGHCTSLLLGWLLQDQAHPTAECGDPGAGPTGEIVSRSWLGNVLGIPQ